MSNRYDEGSTTAIAVDISSNVFVTGGSNGDYATVAYSSAGDLLWINRYEGPENGDHFAFADGHV